MNMEPIETDLLTYACVLARAYALMKIPDKTSEGSPNTFKPELEKERELVWAWLLSHTCLERDVVQVVRKTIPDTNWDQELNETITEVMEAINIHDELKLKDATEKLRMYKKEDWREREHLEKLLNQENL